MINGNGGRNSKKGKGVEKKRQKSEEVRKNKEPCLCLCLACEEGIEEDSDCVECGLCKEWCHKICSKLSNKHYSVLCESGEELLWVCEKCRSSNSQVKSRADSKLDKIIDMMSQLTLRIVSLEEGRGGRSVDEMVKKEVESKVSEILEEKKEKESRRMNLILVNIPETEEGNPEVRKQDDLNKVFKIAKQIDPEILNSEISNPVRLGKKVIGSKTKPRLLKVTVQNDQVRNKILAGARRLNEGVKDASKRVYVNMDRTQKERENFKKLKEELEIRKKEDSDLVIRGGKIVKVKKGLPEKEDGQSEEEKKKINC